MPNDKHIFAIFFERLSKQSGALSLSNKFVVEDKALWHRLTRILRLKNKEKFILFDNENNVKLRLLEENFTKKNVVSAKVISISPNKKIIPYIVLACTLLKKDSFESVAYYAAEMGANTVLPFFHSKTQRKWGEGKELLRLKKIIISACEQAKNFSPPNILNPLPFDKFLDEIKSRFSKSKKIYFDKAGKPLLELLNDLKNFPPQTIILTVGPESDLKKEESYILRKAGFDFVALTPTVLRSQEAVAVGLGSIRSSV